MRPHRYYLTMANTERPAWATAIMLVAIGCSPQEDAPLAVELSGKDLTLSVDHSLSFEEPGEVVIPIAGAFSDDGRQLAVLYNHYAPLASSRNQSVGLVDVATSPSSHQTRFRLGAIEPPSYGVTGVGNTGSPFFANESAELLAIIPAWSPNRPYVTVVDVFSGEPRFQLERDSDSPISAWAFSPDGSALAICGQRMERDPAGLFRYVDGVLHVWDLNTATLRFSHSFDGGTYGTVAFSPHSMIVAVGGGVSTRNEKSGKVELLDAVTGEVLNTFHEYVFPVPVVLFTPGGDSIISCDLGGTICMLSQLREHPGETESIHLRQSPWTVSKLAISPDGTLLAVALSNFNRGQKQGEIRLIDVIQKVQVGTLMPDSRQPIDYIAFSPDGTRLASQSLNELTIWRITESSNDIDNEDVGSE